MKASNLFWGFFFITLGALYLVTKYTAFYFDWYFIWDLWPLLLIFMGLSIMLKGSILKPIIGMLNGIIAGFFVFIFFENTIGIIGDLHENDNSRWENISEQNYNIGFDDSIEIVNLLIEGGAGKFYIDDVTEDLFNAVSNGSSLNYKLNQMNHDSTSNIKFLLEDNSIDLFNNSLKNDIKISLNEIPIYNLDLKIGASKSYLNLIPFKIHNMDLKTGVANTKIKLGDKSDKINLSVEMGMAKLKIYIPKKAGCKIFNSQALGSIDLDGFVKDDEDNYVTENFHDAKQIILMDIRSSLSSFVVKRY